MPTIDIFPIGQNILLEPCSLYEPQFIL